MIPAGRVWKGFMEMRWEVLDGETVAVTPKTRNLAKSGRRRAGPGHWRPRVLWFSGRGSHRAVLGKNEGETPSTSCCRNILLTGNSRENEFREGIADWTERVGAVAKVWV